MDLMLFDSVIAFDHYRQKVLLITGVRTENVEQSYKEAQQRLEEMAELMRNGEPEEFKRLKLQSEILPQFPKEKYCQMVEKAKRYIREGDIFQIVLSNPMRAKAEGSLFDTYRALRLPIRRLICSISLAMILRLREPPRRRLRSWSRRS